MECVSAIYSGWGNLDVGVIAAEIHVLVPYGSINQFIALQNLQSKCRHGFVGRW